MHSIIFAITAALAATAAAFDCHGPYFSFYNRHGPAMSSQRLDPALFPGQQSPHMHDFDGGNALSADVSYESLQGSDCTTARIKPDKSLYWRPALYWNGNGTGMYPVPNSFLKIYYKFGDNGNAKAKNISEFPEDFSMIAGDPFRRSEDEKNEAGIDWTCIGEDYSRITAKGFPTGFTSCGQGLTTQLTFPSCWNGNALDPKKPNAHMAYPSGGGSGIDACPEGFQAARFPAIFIEFWWDVKAFDGQYSANDNPWVLAQGDPTGFGMHADFKNGWAKGVLAKATSDDGYCNCGCGCGDDQMRECFGAENVNNDADISTCAAKSAFADEAGVVEKLPGCNPIQEGPGEATAVSGPDCTAAAAPGAGDATSAVASATSAAASIISSAASEAISAVSSIVATIADIESTATPESTSNPAPETTLVSKSRHGHHHYHTAVPGGASEALPADAESSECTNAATVTVTPPPVTVTVTATAAGGYAVDRRRRRHN
ncbi:uncharacterized protein CC84DRAFT_809205 [Paraphaeosphaeria sporulosa]|uniref:DUF1996 domain-containing protein n=1 Tax=Paraphaeosphaeria sporulosa TaxID=1460663 RepID=A0A177CBD8_9PLEO|nr:uncharacterized protein CC84DRAFT_809205 [Paraphaeosphaeria sporulosa]OAG04915.1 hypothetical protein CC84DRAFT_809205 [Paraphaeosphaeria sporulosa]